jgi:hypothetical protein
MSRYVLRYAGADGRLYENLHVKPRFFGDGARITILSARGDAYALDVDAATNSVIRSSVGWSRWWRVSNAQANADGPFLAFAVPAGHTTVKVRYVATSFRIASLIALLTAATLLCLMIRARVQRHMDLHRRALRDRDRMRPAVDSGGP